MIDLKNKTAACDWVNCYQAVALKEHTLREIYLELRRRGWRASVNLGEYCICPNHREP